MRSPQPSVSSMNEDGRRDSFDLLAQSSDFTSIYTTQEDENRISLSEKTDSVRTAAGGSVKGVLSDWHWATSSKAKDRYFEPSANDTRSSLPPDEERLELEKYKLQNAAAASILDAESLLRAKLLARAKKINNQTQAVDLEVESAMVQSLYTEFQETLAGITRDYERKASEILVTSVRTLLGRRP
ncbi:hypothetical protein QFC22_006446 [Naganishia vaughanmartiniae]|uniref:Uncharacterized protein n=1 Tax=Naganishia vaughanmartiniae TaxID=1424756 RepID=A0ACC2WJG4_9TREE|nr:hypothetical protein QFC22_006446 [Naganishia vaughanmartiniae]